MCADWSIPNSSLGLPILLPTLVKLLLSHLGNEVFPLPEVVSDPMINSSDVVTEHPSMFPTCVLTCTQQKKLVGEVDLSSLLYESAQEND